MQKSKHIIVEQMADFKTDELDTFLHKILYYVRDVINCDGGTIYLKHDNYLKFHIFQNDSLPLSKIYELYDKFSDMKYEIVPDTNIISVESFINSQLIMIDNVYNEEKYDFVGVKKFDEQYNYKTQSILTLPLTNFDTNEKIGVIQLINKKDKNKNFIPFNRLDKELMAVIDGLITMSISLKLKNTTLFAKLDELHNISNKDNLTSLYNRNYFKEVIMTLVSLSHRSEKSLSLLMADIDLFKNINDTYGHIAGDEVLKNVAHIFETNLRKSDIPIRYGGEEFLIILPNTNLLNAKIVANNLRKKIANLNTEYENNIINTTISIGVSELKQNEYDINELIKRADIALYEAKKQGRDKIIAYEDLKEHL